MNANLVKKVVVVFAVMMFAGQTSTMTVMAESKDVSVKQFSALQGIDAEAMTSSELSEIEGRFNYGQCTWEVNELVKSNWGLVKKVSPSQGWGNAKDWLANAKKSGYKTGTTPKVNSILVYNSGVGVNGHVAFVTKVNSNSNFVVKEMNWPLGAGVRARTVTSKDPSFKYISGFIYKK